MWPFFSSSCFRGFGDDPMVCKKEVKAESKTGGKRKERGKVKSGGRVENERRGGSKA